MGPEAGGEMNPESAKPPGPNPWSFVLSPSSLILRPLLDRHGDFLARAGNRVVQIVAELQRELVLARRELRVEHVFAVAEVDPRRRAFDDVLPGRQAALVDPDVIVRLARPHLLLGEIA